MGNAIAPVLVPLVIASVVFSIVLFSYKVTSGPMKENMQRQAQKRGGYIEHKFYQMFPKLVIPYGDREIFVYITPGGRNSPPYTHFLYKYSSGRNIKLTVYNEGALAKFGKALGMQDIVVNDPVFDESFIIKGKDETLVRQLLSSDIKQKLLGLVILNMTLKINNNKVHLSVPSAIKTDIDYESFINAGLAVVNKVSQLA